MASSLTHRATRMLAPRAGRIAPGPTAKVVHQALHRAIAGVGPLDGAASAAEKALAKADGDKDAAVDALVSTHLRLAAGQGFVTNIGGLVTLAASVPANIAGLAVLQCRMVAAIAAVHGHDLADDGVRNAVLTCILGRSTVDKLVKHHDLPGTPRQLATGEADTAVTTTQVKQATATEADGPTGRVSSRSGATDLDRVVAAQVATALISNALGKRLAVTVGKRVPVVGGVVGAGGDYWATRRVAAYARAEFAVPPKAG